MDKKIGNLPSDGRIVMEIKTEAPTITGEIDGQTMQQMIEQEAIFEIKTNVADYRLPTKDLDLAEIARQLGPDVFLEEIKVTIEISKSTPEVVNFVRDLEASDSFKLMVEPVEFEVKCSADRRETTITKFQSFVERSIPIPENVDPSKITTAVVVAKDGTLRSVPTKIELRDSKYYAVISSMSNSVYALISTTREFSDLENHWAKESIETLARKLILNGNNNSSFEPERYMTRAEFSTALVRSLGIDTGEAKNPFSDVSASKWYEKFITSAYEYDLITGYGTKFNPENTITRQQAMVMIVRAMKISNMSVEINSSEIKSLLSSFPDANSIDQWAIESIAICLKYGIISGNNSGNLAPDQNITRAEIAVLLQRFLEKADLI